MSRWVAAEARHLEPRDDRSASFVATWEREFGTKVVRLDVRVWPFRGRVIGAFDGANGDRISVSDLTVDAVELNSWSAERWAEEQ